MMDEDRKAMLAEGARNRARRSQVIQGMSTTLDAISRNLEADLESLTREQMLFKLRIIKATIARTERS